MRGRKTGVASCLTAAAIVAAAATVSALVGCDGGANTPTGADPYGRTGDILMRIECDVSGRAPLGCRALSYCAGFYPCPGFQPGDVTAIAPWLSRDPQIAAVVSPGTIQPASPGDTVLELGSVVTADGRHMGGGARQPVSVLPDLTIFPTGQIQGSVYDAGTTPGAGGISGAIVEIVNGRAVGRTALTGTLPAKPPGYFDFGCEPSYRYCFHGVAPDTYRLRVTASGFLAQEREIKATIGTVYLDFPLVSER